MDTKAKLRNLPKVDALLTSGAAARMLDRAPRVLVVEAIRDALEAIRCDLLAGVDRDVSEEVVAAEACVLLKKQILKSLRRVINATGVIVHTNLGRSPLAEEAVAAVAEVARGYSTLEYDVSTGERGSRHVHVEEMLCRLTGAEAAMAVNNNAAAVMMGLTALAHGKEAIVSRGQLVEIGGSFRVPDIMAQSGATMVEVGTTNKTHLDDYEKAITDRTGLLLKVHTSNFRVVGFTEEVPLEDLVSLGHSRGIPVFEDQGSGVLIDLTPFGLPGEPTIGASVAAGADLVSASGDKLLGGPQAGLLLGSAKVIGMLKKHPLARAMRLDKMTLAALEVTLRLYLDPAEAVRRIPTLRMLTTPKAEIAERAVALAERLRGECGEKCMVQTSADVSRSGGGALPLVDIPTVVVAVEPRTMSVVELERRLRTGDDPSIVTRIREDRLLIDPRTLTADEETTIVARIGQELG
jgi:L-seryl-tRNA(Ser) seleniumtransferase